MHHRSRTPAVLIGPHRATRRRSTLAPTFIFPVLPRSRPTRHVNHVAALRHPNEPGGPQRPRAHLPPLSRLRRPPSSQTRPPEHQPHRSLPLDVLLTPIPFHCPEPSIELRSCPAPTALIASFGGGLAVLERRTGPCSVPCGCAVAASSVLRLITAVAIRSCPADAAAAQWPPRVYAECCLCDRSCSAHAAAAAAAHNQGTGPTTT